MDGKRKIKEGSWYGLQKTAQECQRDYELYRATVVINDGLVSDGETEEDSDGSV